MEKSGLAMPSPGWAHWKRGRLIWFLPIRRTTSKRRSGTSSSHSSSTSNGPCVGLRKWQGFLNQQALFTSVDFRRYLLISSSPLPASFEGAGRSEEHTSEL